MTTTRNTTFTLGACLLSSAFCTAWAAPPAAIEMTSLLEAFQLHHQSGQLNLNARTGANAAFVPANASMQVVLTRKGDRHPLAQHAVRVRSLGRVWSNLQVEGSSHYQFTESGNYTLTYLVQGKPITSFDFRVSKQSGDDLFAPAATYFVDGPWSEYAFLQVVGGKPSTPLTFKLFTRQATAQPDNNMRATVELFREGTLVAQANSGGVAWSEWSLKEFSFSYPVEQGGQKYAFADLVKNDGEYVIIVKMDGRDYGHYPISVQGGKVVPHPRQTMTHTPSTKWLVPRRNSGLDSADPIFYLPRSASSTTAPVKADTAYVRPRASRGR